MVGVATLHRADFRLVMNRAAAAPPCARQVDTVHEAVATAMVQCVLAVHAISERPRPSEALINVTFTQLPLPTIVACAAESIDANIVITLSAMETRS